jgi:hypothetical protein
MKKICYILFIGLAFTACKKDFSSSFIPYPNANLNDTVWLGNSITNGISDSLIKALDTLNVLTDSFDVTLGKTFNYNSNDQLTVSFPKFPQGAGIGSNMVKFELLILKKRGDFIRVLAPTRNFGKPLEASYCFYLRLTKNGQEIIFPSNLGYYITWNDNKADKNMNFFEGYPLPNADSLLHWMPSLNGSIRQSFQPGSTSNIKGYEYFSSVTHWSGGLKYIDTTNGTTKLNVSFTALNFTNKNTVTFAVFKNNKTVLRLTPNPSNKTFFTNGIPVNTQLTIVTISLIDNQFYLGKQDVTITNNNLFSVAPDKKNISEIHTFLDNL